MGNSNSLKLPFLLVFSVLTSFSPLRVEAQEATKTKDVQKIYYRSPFLALGDIGQYTKTMSQGRDKIRREFWKDLTETLEMMAFAGARVDRMIEPLTNALLIFDSIYDDQKVRDAVLVDQSLEYNFKSFLQREFQKYGIPSSGQRFTFVTDKKQMDYLGYGTFSSIGHGYFQLTYHLQNRHTGQEISFAATGELLPATAKLASQVFAHFQKIEKEDWTAANQEARWITQPANPQRALFTFEEAYQYCKSRGYRLPFAREILDAANGSEFRDGGIQNLKEHTVYPVADRRMMNDRYVLVPGTERSSAGPIHGASSYQNLGFFYCVKGKANSDVLLIEELWKIRRTKASIKEVVQAVDTLRYELGDWGSDSTYWGQPLSLVPRLNSAEEAQAVLKKYGFRIKLN